MFHRRTPSLLVVDDFYADPDQVRQIALLAQYAADLEHYKGLRSTQRFLWPWMREEFSRLLGVPITEWSKHRANGVFQQTTADDPLVWHHDSQSYAGAIYLSPDIALSGGTSFWRDKTYGCRRRPSHPFELARLGVDKAERARGIVYDEYNVEHPDAWELVESIAAVYNRLILWDASLIHSATSYDSGPRLVHLFFFDIA
jgi:hypothetical protein